MRFLLDLCYINETKCLSRAQNWVANEVNGQCDSTLKPIYL